MSQENNSLNSSLSSSTKKPTTPTITIIQEPYVTADYFDKINISNKPNDHGWQCKLCKQNPYSAKTSSSHLKNHLKSKHSISFQIRECLLPNEMVHKIDQALLFFLIFCCLSFNIINNEYFIDFVYQLNPNYVIPNEKALNTLLSELYMKYKMFTINYLKDIPWIHTTANVWNSLKQYDYLRVVIHFLQDQSFDRISLTLSYKNVAKSSIEDINNTLNAVYNDFGIDSTKLISIKGDFFIN